jgi:hypothetical protein
MVTYWLGLEVNLASQLDNSRRVRRLKQPEISVTQIVANVLELGMVEGVEGLQAKLQSASFAEGKGLEEREVPIVTSRSTQSVVAEVAPNAGRGSRKYGRVEVLDDVIGVCGRYRLVCIADLAGQVRAIAATNVVVAASANIDRYAGLDGDDPRDLPATERGLRETARAVAQHRDAVDEVSGKIVGPIKNTRPKIVPPPQVRVGNSIQVLTAATGGRIDGARKGVVSAKLQVPAGLRVQVNLQGVVMATRLVLREAESSEPWVREARSCLILEG